MSKNLEVPNGFRKLAQNGILSLSLIDFLEELGSNLQDNTKTKAVSSSTTASLMLLDIPELAAIERWIVTTLLSFGVAIDRIFRGPGFVNQFTYYAWMLKSGCW
jgi:hypothetical protein